MNQKKEIHQVVFEGGLCNKLFDLFSVCDIILKEKTQILDPLFGWPNKDIYFSEIYDIDYFNQEMKKHNDDLDIIIPISKKEKYLILEDVKYTKNFLGNHLENILREQRKNNTISNESTYLLVMKALKINPKYEEIIEKYKDNNMKLGIHMRIENDWVAYSSYKKVPKEENLLTSVPVLLKMLQNHEIFEENIFFTSGMKQGNINIFLKRNKIKSNYFFNPDFKYELNAAINFELCSRCKYFLGNSRSTFSNLITLKRFLSGNDNSYIYNYQNSIFKREDKGLHCEAEKSIKLVNII